MSTNHLSALHNAYRHCFAKPERANKPRYPFVDVLRGIAVLAMVLFHFVFDLSFTRVIDPNYIYQPHWQFFGRSILASFVFCVGLSLAMAHARAINWRGFARRELELILCAATLSLGTYIAFRDNWVYFGILHHIAFTSLILLPVLRFPLIAGVSGLLILCSYYLWDVNIPWFTLNHFSLDYIPPYPWIGYTLLGIAAYHLELHKIGQDKTFCLWLQFLGRHTLFIYMVHQGVLLGLIYTYIYLQRLLS